MSPTTAFNSVFNIPSPTPHKAPMSSGAAAPSNPLGCRKIKTSVHKFYPKKKDECTTV